MTNMILFSLFFCSPYFVNHFLWVNSGKLYLRPPIDDAPALDVAIEPPIPDPDAEEASAIPFEIDWMAGAASMGATSSGPAAPIAPPAPPSLWALYLMK